MFYTYAVGIDSRHRKGEIVYHYEKKTALYFNLYKNNSSVSD